MWWDSVEFRALLAACLDNPADETPRLVLADYLDENGQHDAAELVRVRVALARGDASEWVAMKAREAELVAGGASAHLWSLWPLHFTAKLMFINLRVPEELLQDNAGNYAARWIDRSFPILFPYGA